MQKLWLKNRQQNVDTNGRLFKTHNISEVNLMPSLSMSSK